MVKLSGHTGLFSRNFVFILWYSMMIVAIAHTTSTTTTTTTGTITAVIVEGFTAVGMVAISPVYTYLSQLN